MIDSRRDLLLSEAEKHIDRLSASLVDMAHLFRYRVEDGYLQERIYDIFMASYENEIVPIFEREERELQFCASSEAKAANEADDARDRMWYRRLMESSKELKDE